MNIKWITTTMFLVEEKYFTITYY